MDSGAAVNLIDAKLWERLKKQNITCKSEKTTRKLFAYGSDKPLDLLGKFNTQVNLEISENVQEVQAYLYVLKGVGPALLGRQTAQQLSVLSIGVNYVDDVRKQYKECFKGIGKLKDYQLTLHINKDVQPIAQRMYRVPTYVHVA